MCDGRIQRRTGGRVVQRAQMLRHEGLVAGMERTNVEIEDESRPCQAERVDHGPGAPTAVPD